MLRYPLGRKYLEQTLQGVREQGIAQVTISQHPSDFLEDGKIIVANADTCFFLGMELSAIEKLKLTPQLERCSRQPGRGTDVLYRQRVWAFQGPGQSRGA